jgi:PAS domain S-box-containing protein
MTFTDQNRFFLQALPHMAWINLPNGDVTFYNQKWDEYTGLSMEGVKEWPPAAIIPPGDLPVTKALFVKMLKEGAPFEIENRYKKRDNDYRWHLNRFEPLKDDNGKIYLWIGTATDIEKEKRAETELKRRQQEQEKGELRFTQIIMESALPIAVFRGKGLIAEIANDAYLSIIERTREEFMGKPLSESLPEIKEAIAPIIEKVMATGVPYKGDEFGRTMTKTGNDIIEYYSFIYEPLRNQYATTDAFMVTATDVTDKVLARKALEEREAHLQLLRDTVPAMIFYLDDKQRYKSYNGVFMDWFHVGQQSAIGKTVREFLGDTAYQKTLPYLTRAYAGEQVRYEMNAPSRMGAERWLSIVYTPHIDNDGEVLGIIVHATDVSQSKLTELSLRKSEERFRSLIQEAPVATCLFTGPEMRIAIANEMMLGAWGKDASVVGMRLEDAVPELKGQPFLDILDEVYRTGIAYSESAARAELEIDGVLGTYYYNFTYKPVFDENGEAYGIIDMAFNVTEQVLVHQRIEESRQELLSLFEDSPVGIAMINADGLVFKMANKFYSCLVGRTPEQMIGKSLLEAVPDLEGQGFEALLHGVIDSGQPLAVKEFPVKIARDGILQTIYTDFTYQPRIEADGQVSSILVVVVDVTAQVDIRKKIEESESKLRTLIQSAPPAIGMFVGRDLIIEAPNQAFIDTIGRGREIEGKSLKEVMPELEHQPFLQLLDDVFTSGKIFHTDNARLEVAANGEIQEKYFNVTFSPLFDEAGDVYAIIDVSIDVTDSVLIRQQIEASEKELRDLINASPIGICVVSGSPLRATMMNERFLQISGKTREQYAAMPYWEALREVAHIFEPALHKVFQTGIRYTTREHEMVLLRDGKEENIFLTFEYIPILDTNGTVTKVIVMAVEVTHQVAIRKEIEVAVIERTKELAASNIGLQRSNAELQQFAYIASHDLQEPVRKISTFANLLEHSLDSINDKSREYLDKISASTERMSALIRDVLSFSIVSQNTGLLEEVDLARLMAAIEKDFELLIEQKRALIKCTGLPIVQAIPTQMLQLFSNLVSNSLKYTRENVAPVLQIKASVLPRKKLVKYPQLLPNRNYHKIEFTDNGIGFDKHHAERIFNIFQRLHGKTEFEGTGIGLSLCRKIVHNHGGEIIAKPGTDGGAVFTIILPVA